MKWVGGTPYNITTTLTPTVERILYVLIHMCVMYII